MPLVGYATPYEKKPGLCPACESPGRELDGDAKDSDPRPLPKWLPPRKAK